jgi:hypothetical protein
VQFAVYPALKDNAFKCCGPLGAEPVSSMMHNIQTASWAFPHYDPLISAIFTA